MISTVNNQLKELKVGVSVRQKGNRLYLRATLPPKPGISRPPHQQDISLGVYANQEGLNFAKSEAIRLGAALATQSFSWGNYIKVSSSSVTCAEWIHRYEEDYFNRRLKTPQSETTWDKDYRLTFAKLPQDEPLTAEICLLLIARTQPSSRTRQRYVMALGSLCRFAGLNPDFSGLSKYSPSQLTPRDLPSDETIEKVRSQITDPSWQWVYGMLSTYGLRPHEVFLIDYEKLLRYDPQLVVLDGKTGSRIVYPFPMEWWENWELPYVQMPIVKASRNSDYGNKISKKFRQYKLPFKAYDLRHRWAIRTLEMGLDRTLAAQQMGHSREIHDKIYHRWISQDIHKDAFNKINNIQ